MQQSSYPSNRQQWTSQDYALQGQEADDDVWVTFDPQKDDIDNFLENNKPSVLQRSDGIGWISVESPIDNDYKPDVVGLEQHWEMLKKSARPINYHTIAELAKRHSVTAGKWLVHIPTGFQADFAWEKIAKATVKGQLGSSAKISPFDASEQNYRHVVCVYNDDFTDRQQVYDLEDKIRVNAGIKCELKYKPDAYTYLGVYRKNKWNIRPTIYESVYILHKGSTITPLYE